jgi:hypothetical protein
MLQYDLSSIANTINWEYQGCCRLVAAHTLKNSFYPLEITAQCIMLCLLLTLRRILTICFLLLRSPLVSQ